MSYRVTIDADLGLITEETSQGAATYPIGTPSAFRILSKLWLRSGWDNKYVYSFTWLGKPIIQLPEDVLRVQEIIYGVKPDVLIETGVAHGGSLVLYASLFRAMGKGRVVGVDIEIRPHNRKGIENHELAGLIALVEGDSVAPQTVKAVRALIKEGDSVMVILDSNHTKAHVLAELEAYAPLVSPGSYIVAADGIMEELVGAPRSQSDWGWNNPRRAALEFVARHKNYRIEEPAFPFNEGSVTERVTYWPNSFIKRL